MATIRCPLNEAAAVSPQEPCLFAGMQRLTYHEVEGRVQELSNRLQEVGLEPGQRLAVCLPNSAEFLFLLWAAWRVGASVLPINPRLPLATRMAQAESIDIALQVGVDDEVPSVEAAGSLLAGLHGLPGSETPPLYTLNEEAVVLFTSGSSGSPKPASLPHRSLYYNARGANRLHRMGRGDVWLLTLPLYHVGGLGAVTRSLLGGAAIALADPAEPIGEELGLFTATHVSLVPTQLQRLVDVPPEPEVVQKLKLVLLGGAAADDALVDDAREAGLPVCRTWGMTEAGSQVSTQALRTPEDCRHSSGPVLTHREVRVDESGQLWVRGPVLFDGYVEDGELVSPMDDEGWYPTGDRGCVDEHGHVWVEGRIDRLFISGGENIQPEEIETVFAEKLQVRAVVVAVSDDTFGQRPFAFVEGLPSADQRPELIQALAARLEEFLPRYKVPVGYAPLPAAAPGQLKVDLAHLAGEAARIHARD